MITTNQKGKQTELEILLYVTKLGYSVSIPWGDKDRYDQIWDINGNLIRIQVKTAKELDEQKIDYEVESLVIPYFDSQKEKYRCAIPDFYIPNQNLIVEIKSNWTLNKQNMIDKFESYKQLGYNYKLICEHKEIKLNYRVVSPHPDKMLKE